MNLNAIQPSGPHIQGFIRFASEGVGEDLRQGNHFEVLSREHEDVVGLEGRKLKAHSITEKLGATEGKIRIIPIKLMFDSPSNCLSARYEAYNPTTNRVTCAGDGCHAQRADYSSGKSEQVECVGPDSCSFANQGEIRCSLSVRLKVQIEGQSDEFSLFELQSRSINTYQVLSAKLAMMHAMFGGRLRHIPLQIAIEARSSMESQYESFYVANLQLRDGILVSDVLGMIAAGDKALAGTHPQAMELAVADMYSNARLAPEAFEQTVLVFKPADLARRESRGKPVPGVASAIADLVSRAKANAVGSDHSPSGVKIESEESVTEAELKPEFLLIPAPDDQVTSEKIDANPASKEIPPLNF